MIKTFQLYLIKLFLKKIILLTLIFSTLIIVLSVFEEISFFKELDINFLFPLLMTFLNFPSVLFDIFPFIFLLSGQLFFISLIESKELEVLKVNGLNNFRIIKTLIITSFFVGLLLISIFYSVSSKFKFFYLELKNTYSQDDKYLAVITENGLWIKDRNDDRLYIINADKIENEFIKNVTITEFDSNFELIKIIKSNKVDISSNEWEILNPLISIDNKTTKYKKSFFITTRFNLEKVNTLFRNHSSLNIFELIKLKKDYTTIGYSTDEIELHLHKIFSYPIYLMIMTIMSSVIMLNIKRNKSKVFHMFFGIFSSVLIYYFYYLFYLLGENGKIPITTSVWLPLLMLAFLITIGLVKINEK